MKTNKLALLGLCLFLVFACCLPSNAAYKAPLSIFVSITPQKFFVEQIGKEHVDVNVLVPPGADPHTYEPKPSQMVKLSKSPIYFSIGVDFEKATLSKVASSAPNMTIIPTDKGIKKLKMAAHHHHHPEEGHHSDAHKKEDHSDDHHDGHGNETEHISHDDHDQKHHKKVDEHHDHEQHLNQKKEQDHESGHHDHGMEAPPDGEHEAGLDPHIWLSPSRVRQQAGTILNSLIKVDPAHERDYRKNYNEFIKKIETLDLELLQLFEGKEGFRFMVFHPAWGYFADEYGLIQMPIEIEGKNPKPAQLKELIKHARENHVHVIFVQPQFSSKSAKLVAKEIKGQVVFADPLAENWFENMRAVGRKFREAIH